MAQVERASRASSVVEVSSGQNAKRRLIDAGITIFGTRGLSSPTVRDITDAAECNVAAINYHFGGRENFLKTILREVFAPIRKRRDENLDAARRRHRGGPIPVLELVEAWVLPLIDAPRDVDGGRVIVRFVQQLWAEPAGSAMKFIMESYDYGPKSYIDAFAQSLPVLPRAEVVWRFEMMRGAALHAIANCDPLSGTLAKLAGGEPMVDTRKSRALLDHIVQFCAAGFVIHPVWSSADLVRTGGRGG